ncbi:MAG: NAD(P)H-dependent oxidoreductase [Chromatiales bacterium]|nr:NAD(P)H-dependent oxidoreductase [Chromatiales bacterium]
MPRRVLVIDGHPDGSGRRFIHALAGAYSAGAEAGGHAVRQLTTGQLEFPLLRRNEDFTEGTPPPDILAAQDAIREADHLVLLFPLWMGDMPAHFKGFLEQVFSQGFALGDTSSGGLPERKLKGKSARIVVTMGMPAFIYRLFFRAHAVRALAGLALRLAGVRPVRTTLIGRIESIGDAGRARWLARLHRLGMRAA